MLCSLCGHLWRSGVGNMREYSVTVAVLGRSGKITITGYAVSKIQACVDAGRFLADLHGVRADDEVVVESCIALLPQRAVTK